jgi:hypothetical protein
MCQQETEADVGPDKAGAVVIEDERRGTPLLVGAEDVVVILERLTQRERDHVHGIVRHGRG